jgi:hypothetical protein
VFSQYYEVEDSFGVGAAAMGTIPVSNDSCNAYLGSCRLKWARNSNGQPFFDLLPLSSLRGSVQIVRGKGGLQHTSVWPDASEDPLKRWQHNFFYINRYALRSEEEYKL